MATKDQVIELHRANPDMNSVDLARLLNCAPGYIRATARREGLTLAGRTGGKGTTRDYSWEPSREDDEHILAILDAADHESTAKAMKRFGVTNNSVQSYRKRYVRVDTACACVKPENRDGGQERGWWR